MPSYPQLNAYKPPHPIPTAMATRYDALDISVPRLIPPRRCILHFVKYMRTVFARFQQPKARILADEVSRVLPPWFDTIDGIRASLHGYKRIVADLSALENK